MNYMYILYCFYIVVNITYGAPLTVLTSYGWVRGSYAKTRGGTQIVQFLGIPYAKSPEGNLRFKSPQRPEPWHHVRAATKECSMCIQQFTLLQMTRDTVMGKEDCLCLNVYTPKHYREAQLPVIVFIHGGAYQGGSSDKITYGPDLLLDEDVILVTVNYRLGIMGFLSTGDDVLPGNYGLKDQVAALVWVRDNIEVFGGDNSLVTLMGQSSGGACVHLHTMSPVSEGLFHRAVMHSGSAFSTWSYSSPEISKQKAAVVAGLLGCPPSPSTALRDCLLKLSSETITDVNHKLIVWDVDPIVYFNPTIEPHSPDAFLCSDPFVSPVSAVPLLAGFNTDEGAFKYLSITARNESEQFRIWNENFDALTPISLMYNWTSPKISLVTKQMRKFYLGDGPISVKNKNGIIDMYSDSWTNIGLLEAVHRYPGPTFLYNYDYQRNVSVCSVYIGNPMVIGPCHFDELMMLFPFGGLAPEFRPKDPDFEMSQSMIKTLTAFGKYGIPLLADPNLFWFPVKSRALEYLKISNKGMSMEIYPIKKRLALWNSLPFRKKIP